MNGPHDLGGRHGFGPLNPEPEALEPVFHAEWERRVFGLTLAAAYLGAWNLDMTRFARERQAPADYLRQSYYETWLVGLEKQLLEAGLITAAELASAIPSGTIDESLKERVIASEQVARRLAQGTPTSIGLDTPPRFQSGERVRAVNRQPTGHTREPRYVRGHVGVIHEYLGAHIFPDRHADGLKEGQHLYNVRFDALELWDARASQASSVYVALWEPYLESV